jgi:hypothetical protein
MAVIRCLKEERDWLVLNLVLSEVPSVLQNKGMLTRFHRYLTFCAHMLHICESVLFTGSVPLTNRSGSDSGSWYFRQWPAR